MVAWLAFVLVTSVGLVPFPGDTSNVAAQEAFERGVTLLHNFEYDTARTAFRDAAAADPQMAMAVWGEAMTYNHPLWNEQDLEGGRATLRLLATLPAPKDAHQRGFVEAVRMLYGNGDKRTRDNAYADAMRALYTAFPEDNEVAAFYGLALLGATQGERDVRVYMRAAGVTEEVFARNPQHPGALHYLIHAYDDAVHAPLGLRAARIYNHIAAQSPHALHMTSHIYLAVGAWDEVVAANQAAWDLGRANNPTGDAALYTVHDLHALEWLAYGHLQQGDQEKALAVVQEAAAIAQRARTPMARWFYALMRAAYMVDTEAWDVPLPTFNMDGVELSARSADLYVNVLAGIRRNADPASLLKAIEDVDRLCKSVPVAAPDETNPDYYTALTPAGVAAGKVVVRELRAAIAAAQGDHAMALAHLEAAVALEDQMPVAYGPPLPVKPAVEALADWLFSEGQGAEALKAYRRVLDRHTGRRAAELGMRRTTL